MRNSIFFEPVSDRRTDWETPPEIFEPLDREFHFGLDVCASTENRKCSKFYSIEENSLAQPWQGICWMNPPYGKNMQWWIQKAYDSAKSGQATVVCLIPVRSNNEWWSLCIQGEIWFVRKKIKFVGADSDLMVPSAIVVFRPYLSNGGTMKIFKF